MGQTFQQYAATKKISGSTVKLKAALLGKKIRVIGNQSGVGSIEIGKTYVLDTIAGINTNYIQNPQWNNQALYFYDFELVTDETIEDIDAAIASHVKNIEEAQGEIEALEAKKEFMVQNKLTVLDEDQYKVWKVLQTLKGKKTDLEKSKEIAKLIKG